MLGKAKSTFLLIAIFQACRNVDSTCEDNNGNNYAVYINCSMVYNPVDFKITTRYNDYGYEINLSFNHSYIPDLTKSTFNIMFNKDMIKGLSITSSHLSNFEEDSFFPSLRNLDLANNNLTNLEGKRFKIPTLKSLNVSKNSLENLPPYLFDDLLLLESFNVSTNKISNITRNSFKTLKNLINLDLSGNEISVLPAAAFGQLIRLEKLDLSKNQLKNLDVSTFIGGSSLLHLDLSGNKLKTVSSFIFQNTPSLRVLKLNDNQLEKIFPQELFEFTKIKSIQFHGNNFKCVELSGLLSKFKSMEVGVSFGPERESLSLHGIKCTGEIHETSRNVVSETALEKFFDFDFKQSNFYKFFEQYKELNSERHLKQDELKYLISGISDAEHKKNVDSKLIVIAVLLSLILFLLTIYAIFMVIRFLPVITRSQKSNSSELDAII